MLFTFSKDIKKKKKKKKGKKKKKIKIKNIIYYIN
jgi:hypothetical protein